MKQDPDFNLIKNPKPFIKWAGGKRQLLDAILAEANIEFNEYYEPFVGGGALYFKLWSLGRIKKAHINDSNPDLVNAYLVIQNNVDELINELKNEKYQNTQNAFYKIRVEQPTSDIEKAARFIYLNKTGFNGLYRVNSKGVFNVPFGRYKNPKILDEQNLRLVNKALERASITCKDFEDAIHKANGSSLIYFDPPYHPLNGTAKFTQYTSNNFSLDDQERLSKIFARLSKGGSYVLLSNSDTEIIKQLYYCKRSGDNQCHCKRASFH